MWCAPEMDASKSFDFNPVRLIMTTDHIACRLTKPGQGPCAKSSTARDREASELVNRGWGIQIKMMRLRRRRPTSPSDKQILG